MSHLLDPAAALELILRRCETLPSERVPLGQAQGRVLARAVTSPANLPPFDNSAMDGFALPPGHTVTGSLWPIEGRQAAGDQAAASIGQGAWEIMTGARVPQGLDRIVPVEQTEALSDPPRMRLLSDVKAGANLRPAGSDVARDTTVLEAGCVLAPRHLMLLAALGVAELEVAAQPGVAVISTGRELVDDPTLPLQSGQIRNSNGPFLAAQLPHSGARLVHRETVGDEVDAFVAAVGRARKQGARILISSGAVSMGRYDFVPEALSRLGGEILFHKLAIRPGKPLLLARLDDGILCFGLPGNPIAVAAGLRFFVEPALRQLMGLPVEHPLTLPLAKDQRKPIHLRSHFKSCIRLTEDKELVVHILPGQQSYRIAPYARANAWAVAPIGMECLQAGSQVEVYSLGHLQALSLSGVSA